MKKVFLIAAAVMATPAWGLTLVSPDGNLRLDVDVDSAGTPVHSLSYKGRTVIAPSHLGLSGREADMTRGFAVTGESRESVDRSWQPVWGEYETVRDHFNELAVTLTRQDVDSPGVMILRYRLFDDGMGFRYEFPRQDAVKYWAITDEHTEFALPGDMTVFTIPGDYDTDEMLFTSVPLSQVRDEFKRKRRRHTESQAIPGLCVQTPMLLKGLDDKPLYVSIHEAALRNYGGMSLLLDDTTMTLTSHITPDRLGVAAYVKLPFHTPWRTVIVSDDARDILASQLIYNLNEPCALAETDWIKPRKFMGVWWEMFLGEGTSWAYSNDWDAQPGVTDFSKVAPSGRHAANTANVKRYIDFAADNGIEGLLVEGWNEGWEDWAAFRKNHHFNFTKPYPDFDIDSLTSYAASRGVKLIMHHETAGNAADYERQLDRAFQYMVDYGYDAVKTGYVGAIIPRSEHHSSQWMVDHAIHVAARAADYRIMVDSHEAVRPTGLCRTYPNWVAQESARGGEFEAMQGNPPEHTCILPFTRLKGGPMDYTPGLFETDMSTYGGRHTHKAGTTIARQLALYLTMPSPLQMACDLPQNYARFMDAFQFIKDVPVDWRDSRYLEAEPGDYITVARLDKQSDDWYVGAITDENARTANIDLSFLPKGRKYRATIYADAADADYQTNPKAYEIRTVDVTSKTLLKQPLARGGGVAIRLQPVDMLAAR